MNTDMINKIKDFAIQKHDRPSDSQRYGSKPYNFHLQMVVDNVIRYKYLLPDDDHEDAIICAWGHDLIEDTDVTAKVLLKMFNHRVADTIYRVSNERGLDEIEILFKTLPKIWQSELATFIKLCDRMANGRNSKNGESDKSKRQYKKYKKQYPIFRYALNPVGNFDDMWIELDEIFDYIGF